MRDELLNALNQKPPEVVRLQLIETLVYLKEERVLPLLEELIKKRFDPATLTRRGPYGYIQINLKLKTMTHYNFPLLIALFLAGNLLLAQEGFKINATSFRINAADKTIEFRGLDRLDVQGTSGNEMVVSSQGQENKRDKRAEGLRKISASGRQDNTGFGIAVSEEGGNIIVEPVGNDNGRLTIEVPNSAIVKISHSTHEGNKLQVTEFGGELDVSVSYNSVYLKNTTGPVAVNTIYGRVEAVYDSQPTNEIRLHSSYSDVDLAIPSDTKADVQLSTGYGSMYTAFDINVKSNMTEDKKHCESDLRGTINGGGTLISLNATYDDIYLRAQ